MPNGGVMIICGRTRKGKSFNKLCRTCGCVAQFECDWKIGREIDGATLTCDEGLCSKHAEEVAPDKHLCPRHAEAWKWHPANKGDDDGERITGEPESESKLDAAKD